MSPRRFALALIACCVPLAAAADERILEYRSHISVHADSSLEVVETIRVRAEGSAIRRGIYRDFPTRYVDDRSQRVVTGFELLGVTRDGRPEPHHEERRVNGIRVYAGAADVMLPPGEHTYEFTYRTDRQLGSFPDHDELYWNVTGNGWDLPIERAIAEIALPASVPRDALSVEAYTGPQGARGQDYTAYIDAGVPVFQTTRPLGAREGLTIVVTWPKGYVSQPGRGAQIAWLLRDARPAVLAVAGLVLLLTYYLAIWNRVGRDPPARIVVPHYEPPDGESPAAMRYLRNMRYDDRTFAAAILSLAVKGRLVIEQETAGLFGRRSKYALTRTTADRGPELAPDEAALLGKLFVADDRLELEQRNHSTVIGARSLHESALKRRYSPTFFRINGGWHLLGIVLSLAIGGVAVVLPAIRGGYDPQWFLRTPPGWLTVAVILAGLVANGLFGRLLKAPTVAGRKVMDAIEGFRLYLDVAEGDELKLVNAPPLTPALFETNLPAALALGVEQHWAERFADVFATREAGYAPRWYQGDRFTTRDIGHFSTSFSSSFDSAISSASTAPGSSSGSGGGGSSGGGGGGGGGGGW